MTLEDDFSDSFLLHAAAEGGDSAHSAINIVDMLLEESQNDHKPSVHPQVLSQIVDDSDGLCAGQIETEDGQVIPIAIGQTDIGNGKPRPYIHISDSPSVLAQHVTITAVQTNDGKFRAMLRVNHPHGRVLLGGSIIRPETMYPITDEDEIVLGDGVRFKLRLNNRTPRLSIGGPTQHFMQAPNSDELHESEQREKETKRRNFQERMTPPGEDSLLLELVAAVGSSQQVSLVHQAGDTHPYSSSSVLSAEDAVCAAVLPQQDEKSEEVILGEKKEGERETDSTLVQAEKQKEDESDIELEGAEREPEKDALDGDFVLQGEAELEEEPQDNNDPMEMLEENMEQEDIIQQILDEKESKQLDENEEKENEYDRRSVSQRVAGPQLSQENSSPEEGFRRRSKRNHLKREQSESSNGKGKRVKVEETQERRSSRGSGTPTFQGGPEALVLLRTAVEIDKATESAVNSIGVKFESKITEKVDALVTGSIFRTTKFLFAINKGLAIFPKTILNEIRMNRSLPPTDQPELWLFDPEGEAKYGFSLRISILQARENPLLKHFDVYCYKNSIGEFSPDDFKALVTSAGGTLIQSLPTMVADKSKIVVIGTDKNKRAAKSSGLKFINRIEFLVDACIKQTLDFDFARINIV